MTMLIDIFTITDLAAAEWRVNDAVVRLREWGAGTIHPLPEPPMDECTIGAGETRTLRLDDPSKRVSRLHARLVQNQGKWLLRDDGSKNGLSVDGSLRSETVLVPGLEISIGGIVLIAESALSIALRGFLARLLGWGSDRTGAVDHALRSRSVRMAATRRVALVVCGGGDLVPTAHSIHGHSRGSDRPFIVCDPRRLPG